MRGAEEELEGDSPKEKREKKKKEKRRRKEGNQLGKEKRRCGWRLERPPPERRPEEPRSSGPTPAVFTMPS